MKVLVSTTVQAVDDRGFTLAAVTQNVEQLVGVIPENEGAIRDATAKCLSKAGDAILDPAVLAVVNTMQAR